MSERERVQRWRHDTSGRQRNPDHLAPAGVTLYLEDIALKATAPPRTWCSRPSRPATH